MSGVQPGGDGRWVDFSDAVRGCWTSLSLLKKKTNPANSHFSMVCSLFQVDLSVAAKSQVENTNVYFVVTMNRQWKP